VVKERKGWILLLNVRAISLGGYVQKEGKKKLQEEEGKKEGLSPIPLQPSPAPIDWEKKKNKKGWSTPLRERRERKRRRKKEKSSHAIAN